MQLICGGYRKTSHIDLGPIPSGIGLRSARIGPSLVELILLRTQMHVSTETGGMPMKRKTHRLIVVTAVATLALALPIHGNVSSVTLAVAKDGGGNGGGNGGGSGGGNGGNGGGNGGGNSGGRGGGYGNGNSASDENGLSARGGSKDNRGQSESRRTSARVDTLGADHLGPLNAAHASARARERAAPDSAVGKIATYEQERGLALEISDPVLREEALADAIAGLEDSFGRKLTDAQVREIDALLDRR